MKKPRDTGKMTPAEIREAAYEAIVRELGPSGLFRFIQDFSLGSGNYVKDRRDFLPKGNVRDLARKIRDRRGSASSKE
jgi:hypothetical protein